MSENINISQVEVVVSDKNYASFDLNLIQQFEINKQFGTPEDYIELYIYDLNNNLLYTNSNFKNYTFDPQGIEPSTDLTTILKLNPEQDVRFFGIDRGTVTAIYSFYKRLLSSSEESPYWIKEISPSRTELKVVSQNLSNEEILEAFTKYQTKVSREKYAPDFLLNFGSGQTEIGVNLATTIDSDGDVVVLVKLYDPLPLNIDTKSTFWFVERISESAGYNVTFTLLVDDTLEDITYLRGPNLAVALNEKANQTLECYNYEELFSSAASSSYQQVKSLLEEKGVEINIDYTDFSNFVHFSSITDRIFNFKYKIGLIESYSADLLSLSTVTPTSNTAVIGSTQDILQSKINNIIEKFDGYEYYLYYETGSTCWPKQTTSRPYSLFSITSSQAINWLGATTQTPTPTSLSILYSASYYDSQNKDLFINTIPGYLRDDSENLPYETFLNMAGQHFDNIWIYLKDVIERYNANNSLTKGISKDLISNTLKGLGINLYTNTNISNNLYYSILGYNWDGSLLPPTGSEQITYYVTSSAETMAAEDITFEFYKRLYHNLPYLLKTKGTERGIRALISCYGLPDTLLSINEFGGVTKESDYKGYRENRFSLAYKNSPSSSIAFPWAPSYYYYLSTGNANLVPDGVEFRFRSSGIPVTSSLYSQSLFQVGADGDVQYGVRVTYNPNIDLPTSSYANYGDITLFISGSSGFITSSAIHVPVFDNTQWYSLLLQKETGSAFATTSDNNRYWLYIKSSFFNEEGISRVGFEGSSSIFIDGTTQNSYNQAWSNFNPNQPDSFVAYLGGTGSQNVLAPDGACFDGYFQEFRYWVNPLPEEVFNRHVLNSTDYSGRSVSGSLFDLIFRAPLGNNLTVPYKDSNGLEVNSKDYDKFLLGTTTINPTATVDTVHPALTGSFYSSELNEILVDVNSFLNGGAPYGYGQFTTNNSSSFEAQEFTDLILYPDLGINQKVNNKIIIEDQISGSYPVDILLNPNTSLQRYPTNRTISTPDLEVAYSPADIIDQDIVSQLGFFQIDDYIGAPSERYTDNYVDLEALKEQYFAKYRNSYNYYDFIRLLKYIDNSLFKLIKDFTPARANLSTGVVIKSHILERPKYKRVEPVFTQHEYSGSIDTAFIEAGVPLGKEFQTGYTSSIETPLGLSIKIAEPHYAEYTGDYSGSTIQAGPLTFPQVDVSSTNTTVPGFLNPLTAGKSDWAFTTYSLNPLQNNVSESRVSQRFYDADYSIVSIRPVNYGLISYSIEESAQGNPQYSNPYIPWAQIQDSNYSRMSYLLPRYIGSKTESRLYTSHSVGDKSYGPTAAIDKIRNHYAYLKDIYASSLTLPLRSNAQIKYLIDNEENVLDLTKENNNLFDVQNTFKGGEKLNISLFDYTNQQTNYLTNRSIEIYEGGWRYLPILHNLSGSESPISWSFSSPVAITQVVPPGGTGPCTNTGNPAAYTLPSNWEINATIVPETPSSFALITIDSVRYLGLESDLPTGCSLIIPVGITNMPSLCYPIPDNIWVHIGSFIYSRTDFPGVSTTTLYGYPVEVGCLCSTTPSSGPACNPNAALATLQAGPPTSNDPIRINMPAGFQFQINNTTGTDQLVSMQTPCDTSAQAYVIPPGVNTYCLVNSPSSLPAGVEFNLLGAPCSDCFNSGATTYTQYLTSLYDPIPCLRLPNSGSAASASFTAGNPQDYNGIQNRTRLIKFSQVASTALLAGYELLFDQSTDPYYSGSNIESIVTPFTIASGDAIHFYSSSLGWTEKEEYRVVTTFYSGSQTGQEGPILYALLDRPLNLNVLTDQPTGISDGLICRYIVAKHIPDETNVILRYNTLATDLTEEGILYPQYILEAVRKNAGNVIKSLKSQGLI